MGARRAPVPAPRAVPANSAGFHGILASSRCRADHCRHPSRAQRRAAARGRGDPSRRPSRARSCTRTRRRRPENVSRGKGLHRTALHGSVGQIRRCRQPAGHRRRAARCEDQAARHDHRQLGHPDAHRARQRRATCQVRPAVTARRHRLVPALLRARRRFRPRGAEHQGHQG